MPISHFLLVRTERRHTKKLECSLLHVTNSSEVETLQTCGALGKKTASSKLIIPGVSPRLGQADLPAPPHLLESPRTPRLPASRRLRCPSNLRVELFQLGKRSAGRRDEPYNQRPGTAAEKVRRSKAERVSVEVGGDETPQEYFRTKVRGGIWCGSSVAD